MKKSRKHSGIKYLFLGGAFLFAGSTIISAQEPVQDQGGEVSQVENIEGQHPFKLEKDKDPFMPLIQKPKPPDPPQRVMREVATFTYREPPKEIIPPLKLSLQGICGNETERLAMIIYENELKVMKKDEEVNGKFKLVDILPDKVVVYSFKEQIRRTFPIGGGKE